MNPVVYTEHVPVFRCFERYVLVKQAPLFGYSGYTGEDFTVRRVSSAKSPRANRQLWGEPLTPHPNVNVAAIRVGIVVATVCHDLANSISHYFPSLA